MAYTASQQAKLDAAQVKLDNAKAAYATSVQRYNDWVASIQPCYKDQIPGASDAATWYNPVQGPCTSAGSGCTQASVQNCKNVVDKLNADIIPELRKFNSLLNDAQNNFNKVLSEVGTEASTDPALILEKEKIAASAKATQLKWIFAIIVFVVVSIGTYIWYKYFRNR